MTKYHLPPIRSHYGAPNNPADVSNYVRIVSNGFLYASAVCFGSFNLP